MIKPIDLIEKFKYALNHNWGYIYGTAGILWTQAKQNAAEREKTKEYGQQWVGHTVADCSGMFTWAFKQLGGYMYHGSNTMYLKYTTAHGVLTNGKRDDGKELLPGTAVFKYSEKYENPYYHVGLYIGNNVVIEAQGTRAGVITSTLSSGWNRWGELKGVDYTATDTPAEKTEPSPVKEGTAHVTGGTLNVRSRPSVKGSVLKRLPSGTEVHVTETVDESWSEIQWTETGYVMSRYLAQ